MIIGLCGYAQVGKDTIAKALENYQRFAFADALKSDVTRMLASVGIEADLWGENKAFWRDMLVFWGAKMRLMNKDHWIQQLYLRIANKLDDRIVITDVRYANEVEWIQKKGGLVIRITRPGYGAANEEERLSFEMIERTYNLPVVCNDGTPEQAAALVREMAKIHFTRVVT